MDSPRSRVTDALQALDLRWVRLKPLRVADPIKPMIAMDSPPESCMDITHSLIKLQNHLQPYPWACTGKSSRVRVLTPALHRRSHLRLLSFILVAAVLAAALAAVTVAVFAAIG